MQFQTNPRTMPIEDASVEWNERESPYVPLARIRIPKQAIDEADTEQTLRIGGLQSLARAARASAARQHESRPQGNLPDDGCLPRPAGVNRVAPAANYRPASESLNAAIS